MKYKLSEKKALKKLGIPDFRHMTKDKLVQFVSMLPKMDPEVAKAAIGQFPNFKDMAIEMTKILDNTVDKTFQSAKESQNAFYDACKGMLVTLNEELKKEDLSPDERAQIRDEMMQIISWMGQKDSEHKRFLTDIFTKSAIVAMGFVGFGISLLGGNLKLSNPRLDGDEENTEDDSEQI